MPSLVLYLVKCSISLSIVWIFYQVLLRRLTFYNLNRWYLLGYSLLSFFIPFIDIGGVIEKDPARQPLVIQLIPSIGDYKGVALPVSRQAAAYNPWSLVLGLVALGSVILLVRLAARWLSLRGIRQKARLIGHEGIRIYQVDEPIIPFSFGSAIYINKDLHSEKEWEEIIVHEYVHIRQRHTIDILFAELMCILNWYNPFVWLLCHSIRQNLEFIADQKVLEQGLDKKKYQYHLLKVIGEPRYRLANNFNFSSLKKRIVMMNKIKSARLQLVKFLFILPLIAVLLVAFRSKYEGVFHRHENLIIHQAGIDADINGYQPQAEGRVTDKVMDHFSINLSHPAALPAPHTPDTTTGKEDPDRDKLGIGTEDGKILITVNNKKVMPDDPQRPLLVLDGVPGDYYRGDIATADIFAIDVLKSSDALALYGPKGRYGAIALTTKKGMTLDTLALRSGAWMDALQGKGATGSEGSSVDLQKALYFVDGVGMPLEAVRQIPAGDLFHMSVLKAQQLGGEYGEKGKYGVVLVRTRKVTGSNGILVSMRSDTVQFYYPRLATR